MEAKTKDLWVFIETNEDGSLLRQLSRPASTALTRSS